MEKFSLRQEQADTRNCHEQLFGLQRVAQGLFEHKKLGSAGVKGASHPDDVKHVHMVFAQNNVSRT